MSLTIPSYPSTYTPTLADHLTRGLLSGLWEGKSVRIIDEKKQEVFTEPLPFHVTLLKVVCIATIIPILVALYLNWIDQQSPPVLPPTSPKIEEQLEVETPNDQYSKNLDKINKLPHTWKVFFMTMLMIRQQGSREVPEWTCYVQNQKYFGHTDDPNRLKPSDMPVLWNALIKNIDKLNGKETVEADYPIKLVKGN